VGKVKDRVTGIAINPALKFRADAFEVVMAPLKPFTGTDVVLRTFVDSIRYKPGWTFSVVNRDDKLYPSGQFLSIRVTTTDACGGKDKVCIVFERSFGEMLYRVPSKDEWNQFVYRCIEELEKHEIAEWLKIDGQHVIDPHPELRSRGIKTEI